MSEPTHRVIEAARERGLDVVVQPRPKVSSLHEAADALGVGPGDIVKSLVVKRSDDTYLFALIPGDRNISWPKLRALVGVNKLQLPDAAAALEATGYERGTITPIGALNDWPVYLDEAVAGRRIILGAGVQGFSLTVAADDLAHAYNAIVADISKPID